MREANDGAMINVLDVTHVSIDYKVRGSRAPMRAVNDVSLSVAPGETLGLIGESGSGKSSLALAAMGMIRTSAGEVRVAGQAWAKRDSQNKALRQRVQMVFQDPRAALDPRYTVEQAVAEPLRIHGRASARTQGRVVAALLDRVGIPSTMTTRKPHQLSGGQCQRVNIARALALEPDLLVCDEAVSALDVSVQAGVLNLLSDLQTDLGVAIFFISHDLAVVNYLSDHVAVMYMGRVVEYATASALAAHPAHPYTVALRAAEPQIAATRSAVARSMRTGLPGDPPDLMDLPSGCHFRTRCPLATDLCAQAEPELRPLEDGRLVACHFAELPPAAARIVAAASPPSARPALMKGRSK